MLLDHPATSRRLAERICRLLLGEAAVAEDDVAALAAGLRERHLDVGWAIETVLRSRRFFAMENLGRRISGPPEFVVGAVRALEVFDPLPNTLVLAEWAESLGQDLFYPPSVGGWAGGRAWLTTRGCDRPRPVRGRPRRRAAGRVAQARRCPSSCSTPRPRWRALRPGCILRRAAHRNRSISPMVRPGCRGRLPLACSCSPRRRGVPSP